MVPTPAQWVAKVKAFVINSVHKHTGKKKKKKKKALVSISILNTATWIQFNYFLPMALKLKGFKVRSYCS